MPAPRLRGLDRSARRKLVWTALVCPLLALSAHGAAVLPPGFTETDLAGYAGPVALAFTPDGALWVAQSGPGEGMHVWKHGSGLALSLEGFPVGERGIHAIAIDPDYATNGEIWIYYTHLGDPVRNRLSRFTDRSVVNPAAGSQPLLENEAVVWEGPPLVSTYHNGGCLAIAADGTIYIGTGDDLQGSLTSQDPFDVRGKILHMDRDGGPAADNPFDGSDGDPLVWALGLRNPFSCALQPGTDNLFIGDVGGAQWEEVNLGFPGANFGWAIVEGEVPAGVAGMTYPIIAYPHDDARGSAVILGAHARPGDFDPLYEGQLFYADWARGEIYRAQLGANNELIVTEPWAVNAGNPVDLLFGPDGGLYYASRGINRVRRVDFVGGANRQPVARAIASPDAGAAPLAVTLDGSGSFDPDEDPLNHTWWFGDGDAATGESTTHEYAAGVYEATLTVDDGMLSAVTPPIRIVAGNRRPIVSVTSPVAGSRYNAGDTVAYAGTATDAEDGVLGCERWTWQVVFHHDEHTHPFIGPLQGACGGSFVVPTLGETSANTWYTVHLRATDSGAPLGEAGSLAGQESVQILPNTVVMSFATEPHPDMTLELDTTAFVAPAAVEGVVGLTRRIGAPPQERDGHTYRWIGWSDGGAEAHDIATPTIDTTFTATFGCDVLVPVQNLRLDKVAGLPTLYWDAVDDACLADGPGQAPYRVYSATTAVPDAGAGQFPSDPYFSWTWSTTQRTYTDTTDEDLLFFLVGAGGTDGRVGPVDHYGQ